MSKSRGRYTIESRLFGLVGLVAAGCGGNASRDPGTVLYASGADLQSINSLIAVHPLAKQVQKNVLFMTLVAYDSGMKPVPRLATPTWSGDRKSVTFQLRRDIVWHDGVPTTAYDVQWTLDAARNPKVAYPRARDLEAVSRVEVVDSFTVRVSFARAQPVFPDVFTDLAILPAHGFTGVSPDQIRTAPFNRQPVGNGPFEFSEYQPGQRWVFRRHDAFPQDAGRASINRLAIVVVDEPATKLAGLTSGELDFAGIAPAHADIVRQNPALRVVDYPVLFSYGVFWNLRRPPFNDPRVRRALDLALDRKAVVDGFLHGFGTVAAGPVPPEHPWYQQVDPVAHDPVTAAKLLTEAGWVEGPGGVRAKDGKPFAFDLLTVGSGDNVLEQAIQAQLKTVGVEVKIRQLELSALLATIQSTTRDFDVVVMGVTGDLSLGYVRSLFDSRDPGPLAYSGYQSRDLDAALDRATTAITEPALIGAWKDVQRILGHDRPVSWLYHARGLQGVSRRLSGVSIDLRGELANVAKWSAPGDTVTLSRDRPPEHGEGERAAKGRS